MSYLLFHRITAALRRLCVFGLLAAALSDSGCGTAGPASGGDLATGPSCDGFNCDPNGCNTTADCAKGLKCDPKSHTCVACAADTDCPVGQVCGPNHTCGAGCSSGHGCASDGGVCEADAGMCVQCLGDGDCTDPKNPRCDPASHSCFPCYTQNDNCGQATYCAASMNAYACTPGCKNDADCPAGMMTDGGVAGGMSHCEKVSHACVECLVSGDCAAGKVCSNGHACVDGCSNTHPCAQGKSCCTGMCTDLTADTANCGGCGNACKAGSNCCSSNCSDPAADVSNCNGCGLVCKAPHATPACTMKTCTIGLCDTGFGDCDGMVANGCEANLLTDQAHCGNCMTACMLPHATPKCGAGVCQIASCAAGFADCDNQNADGCEVNVLGSDLANCGGCGTGCTVANGAPQCAMGVCKVASCNANYGDCDMQVKNGCEVDLTSAASNCGACGTVCSLANATPQCTSSKCAVASCNMGYLDCNKVAADGCEVSAQTDTANCGACGTVCSTNHGAASCAAGVCKITCAAGYADCDGIVANGCESNLNLDPVNCGACKNTCNGTNGTPGCVNGTCNIACNNGFGDCDGNAANGCETNLLVTPASCGGCGLGCSGANMQVNSCSGGACTGTCAAGFGDCNNNLRTDGCETNLKTTVTSCGACGNVCNLPNATPVCVNGGCAINFCANGYKDCNAVAADGCEINAANDVNNCGACSNVCKLANASAGCALGACTVTACNAGYGNCNNVAADGCEINLTNNNNNCGACGTVCANGKTCMNSVCVGPTLYGPNHTFLGITTNFFLSTGQGTCSVGSQAADAAYFCLHFYAQPLGKTCTVQSAGTQVNAAAASGYMLHKNGGCTSSGMDIPNTTCDPNNTLPCKLWQNNIAYGGLINIVCSCQ